MTEFGLGPWKIQEYLGERDLRIKCTTPQIAFETNLTKSSVDHTLKRMSCVKRIHEGSAGGRVNSQDPNVFVRYKLPGDICEDCHFNKNGTVGCVIKYKIKS